MINFLHTYYGIKGIKSSPVRNLPSYNDENIHYIIIPINSSDEFNVEQAVLAYYLREQHQPYIGFPLQNIDEQFITTIEDQQYIVVQIDVLQEDLRKSEGSILATFHQQHQAYPYEPHSISSYGKWKQLWIDKLTVYEQYLQASLSENRKYFERAWLDIFPYVIGMTENSIQYIGNIENDQAFDMSDRPTITFERYTNQLSDACFFHYELHFDHPMRDVAEWIRLKLLQENVNYNEIHSFLDDYNQVQNMSPFSWKLLYARLLYPAHLFDKMDVHRTKEKDWIEKDMVNVQMSQERYEKRLNAFFKDNELNRQKIHIPMVQWLQIN